MSALAEPPAPEIVDGEVQSAGDPPGLPGPHGSKVKLPGDNYKAFIAGTASGIAKLSAGHPLDTVKVRLQTTDASRFDGPIACLVQTLRREGPRGLYKGASPPLVGWMAMDSVMLGSLTLYRRLLHENVFPSAFDPGLTPSESMRRLPLVGHGMAGVLAGWTVSFIAAPIEHVKARLQIQYAADKSQRLYSGPVDCVRKIYGGYGIRGLYRGLAATLLFRTFFFFWWTSYELFTRLLKGRTGLSDPAVNFWAGGLSAQVFWITGYPSDVIKQRIMTDELGHARRFARWRDAAVAIKREAGWRGYWRGFTPSFLRAFPANAVALVAFEGVMRSLG